MTIGLLATGDEIIYGDTLNTNGYTIAKALNSEGLPLGFHLSCSDQEADILAALEFLALRHEIIIITGGLGPTSDDRTRFALAGFLEQSLVEFAEAIQHIETRLKKANLTMNAGNRQQALFPHLATLLPNPHGTAMGCYFKANQQLFILLPGPPRECLPMFNQYVLPFLSTTAHQQRILYKWRLFGVAEGTMAETLDNALKHVPCETGYRLETPYLEFKVRCYRDDLATIQAIINPIVAPYIIATPEQKASERLRDYIAELKTPITIIDEVTGGVLQTLIQRPMNKAWLSFTKTTQSTIWFHLTGLDAYWTEQETIENPIFIDYQIGAHRGKESGSLSFRSPVIVEYAAEWLCFRLFGLINQLHE